MALRLWSLPAHPRPELTQTRTDGVGHDSAYRTACTGGPGIVISWTRHFLASPNHHLAAILCSANAAECGFNTTHRAWRPTISASRVVFESLWCVAPTQRHIHSLSYHRYDTLTSLFTIIIILCLL